MTAQRSWAKMFVAHGLGVTGYVRPARSLTRGGRLLPRRFALVRHVDYTGISGVGVVAYGVVFADGHVALRWASDHPATSLWSSVDDLLAVHGHGDATGIEWLDQASDTLDTLTANIPSPRRARRAANHQEPVPTMSDPLADPPTALADRPALLTESTPEPNGTSRRLPSPVPGQVSPPRRTGRHRRAVPGDQLPASQLNRLSGE